MVRKKISHEGKLEALGQFKVYTTWFWDFHLFHGEKILYLARQ